ncbi:MAG TPA: amidohydrolase family protein [Flavobacteriaceae bacterium]|nr:amidohydrolase family protein [Flavobacteriaceae bacterium]
MIKKKLLIIGILLLTNSLIAQQTPAKNQSKSVLVVGATAHIGDGNVIEKSFIGFENGIINLVDSEYNLDTNNYDTIINASGKHIYPGFIALNSNLGLVEVNSVKASVDDDESGDFLPNVRSIIAYNAESKGVESMRPNGVLLAQVTPNGGIIPGSSSVVQLDAWNWEDAVISYDEGIHLNWPSPYSFGRWWLGEDRGLKTNPNYVNQIRKIEEFFDKSMATMNINSSMNLKSKAMKGIFDGEKTIYLHADDEKEIIDGITFLKKNKISKIVLVGGTGSEGLISFLKENNIPVILTQPYRLPTETDTDPRDTYKIANKLVSNGLLVSINPNGTGQERVATRNLPFYAGSFSSFGLDKEDALSLITLNAAKILNLDHRLGSIKVGKDATLFISTGDALDIMSNNLTHAFISGRLISLETHQTKLWRRYSNKFSN